MILAAGTIPIEISVDKIARVALPALFAHTGRNVKSCVLPNRRKFVRTTRRVVAHLPMMLSVTCAGVFGARTISYVRVKCVLVLGTCSNSAFEISLDTYVCCNRLKSLLT